MKTDETNFPRDPARVDPRIDVQGPARTAPAHTRTPYEREQDALDHWRDSLPEGQRTPPDPVQVHGFDLDASEPETRAVIEAFSADLSRLHQALEAAEARLAWSEEARRYDPDTGLLRRDALMDEIRHLEVLDQQENSASEMALLIVDKFDAFRHHAGRAAAERAMVRLGSVLAETSDPAEPAGRIGDGEFLVLLTGLSGVAADERAVDLAGQLVAAVDQSVETMGLRPGRINIGRASLKHGEDPIETIDRADRDSAKIS